MKYKIYHPSKNIDCTINLPYSKSISNRLLIIQAISKEKIQIKNLSNSDDTNSLKNALKSNSQTINIGAAGTAFRFLTSYLAIQKDKKFVFRYHAGEFN